MIAENVANIRQRIAAACRRAGRSPDDVTLIAVTKTFGPDEVRGAVQTGVFDCGENYVQEMEHKHAEIGDDRIRWHFLGHLQTNKVRRILPWVGMIHAVDSARLAGVISAEAARIGRTVDILVEVNTSGETSKFGAEPGKTQELVREISAIPSLRCDGLMTIGPLSEEPEDARRSFRMLAELRRAIGAGGIPLRHLSMGMTNDFEIAVEEGATMVRIGTAIFGHRTKPGGGTGI